MPPDNIAKRVDERRERTASAEFLHLDYQEAMRRTKPGDLVYCDPPYNHTQTIVYGAQSFSLRSRFEVIAECKRRGVFVALSIDGTKKPGSQACPISVPDNLFEREVSVNCGRSMLRRFQMAGQTLEGEVVADRLLLTYR